MSGSINYTKKGKFMRQKNQVLKVKNCSSCMNILKKRKSQL